MLWIKFWIYNVKEGGVEGFFSLSCSLLLPLLLLLSLLLCVFITLK